MSKQDREAWTQAVKQQLLAAQQPRSKYGAKKTTVDGITFDSKREAQRYHELTLLQKAGEIAHLDLQPRFDLHVWLEPIEEGDEPVIIGRYVADFRYRENRTGQLVVEDAKGFRNPMYAWKKKHFEAQYNLKIRET